ncbi:helix-turn-helix domain-containing protein [Anaerotruncus colihominis]|uniref:Helix-turn-helix domain-containing protein n=1 Tax=Anaerotruncus colihominis TaxID=169435 RepID=A0A845RFC6_9FIRM|nr:helix-turn-helix domain-containing protein [Anaerotruncus colihominis]NBI78484.1 helix-turn-helix domain-containing protein [Anaerotruncus colihominis]
MKYTFRQKPDLRKYYFTLSNEIFSLGLEAGAIAVYSYLLRCEDRRAHQCWPSYKTIGAAVKLSRNTVKKHVAELERKCLITTEPTMVTRQDGRKQNGNLLYTICPIQDAREYFHQQQLRQLEMDVQRQKYERAQTQRQQWEQRPA